MGTTADYTGHVGSVYYSQPDFTVGRFECDDVEMNFTGKFFVKQGDRLKLVGKWGEHPKYGKQFQAERFEYDLEFDEGGLAHFLAKHPGLKGIGFSKAQKIAAAFGRDFEQALEDRIEEVARVGRITVVLAEQIRDLWRGNRAMNNAMVWLSQFGLTHHQVSTLVEKLGHGAISLLRENPYLLTKELTGFGFRRVDDIALKMGVDKNDTARVRAGIVCCLDDALQQGDCCMERNNLAKLANELLALDNLDALARVQGELEELIRVGELGTSEHFGYEFVGKMSVLEKERDLMRTFEQARNPNPHMLDESEFARMLEYEESKLSQTQREAIYNAFRCSISIISGGAGVGKSYTISAIKRMCDRWNLSIALAAPTGKAAKRLEELGSGCASTIHRLLGYNGDVWCLGRDNQLDFDMVVIDEASMMDVFLAWRLFEAIDLERTAVVLVGDHNQLPPVQAGAVLLDLINSSVVPKTILDKVFRQAGILKQNCSLILKGQVAPTATGAERPWIVDSKYADPDLVRMRIMELFETLIPDKLGYDVLRDVQLLTPKKEGPLGTRILNIELQALLQRRLFNTHVQPTPKGRRPKFYVNDKVLATRNDYQLEIMNGAVGIVRSVHKDGSLDVNFDGRLVTLPRGGKSYKALELAYAMTIHKSQGSEFPCVVLVTHKNHSFMHHRNLIYTGVTRAKKTTVLIGDKWGVRNCAAESSRDLRVTLLSLLLSQSQSNAPHDGPSGARPG